MALYSDQFDARFDFPEAVAQRTLVIASTPRCGSHFLGHAIQPLGLFGSPFEYANPANLAKWREVLDRRPLPDVINGLQARRTSPNGVFSIKVHRQHLDNFGGIAAMLALLPDARFVHLRRRDIMGQAISFAIARQTGVWITRQQGNGAEPRYDFLAIHDCLVQLTDHNADWQRLIATSGRPAIALDFEDAKTDLSQAVSQIAALMDVPLADHGPAIAERTRQQGGDRNAEWRAKFIADYRSGRYTRPIAMRRLRRAAAQVRRVVKGMD
ncbi:Stf0 family sulfotransferase [Croceicoccus sp. Ery15]|uniref:Stf0 family sulfotransferase n=1 Tax=Croceicoccus sp. Ery15 TaxID=1703338 RepID=UPI001E4C7DEF|nr:Stf0 family sulfotransferase [Croceicoccus sp. Ery15]